MNNDNPTPAPDSHLGCPDDRLDPIGADKSPHVLLPSQFGIGAPVLIKIQGASIKGNVRAITFTAGKVRYAISVPVDFDRPREPSHGKTTLHNIDSTVVFPDETGKTVSFDFDNYS